MQKMRDPHTPSQLLARRLVLLSSAVFVANFVLAIPFYLFEHGAQGTEIHTYGDALFWTFSQLTSVSSSLANPLTTGGRILAIAIDLLAVSVVTLLVATIVQHSHLVSPARQAYFARKHKQAQTKPEA